MALGALRCLSAALEADVAVSRARSQAPTILRVVLGKTGLWGTPCYDWLGGQQRFACPGWYKTLCRSCCEALARAIYEVLG